MYLVERRRRRGHSCTKVYRRAARPGGQARATATLRRKDGSLVGIDYWLTATKVGGVDFVLVITAPIDTATEL